MTYSKPGLSDPGASFTIDVVEHIVECINIVEYIVECIKILECINSKTCKPPLPPPASTQSMP